MSLTEMTPTGRPSASVSGTCLYPPTCISFSAQAMRSSGCSVSGSRVMKSATRSLLQSGMLPWALLPQPSNLRATRAGDEPGPPGRPSAPSGGGSAPPGRAPASRGAPGLFVQLLVPDHRLDVVAIGIEDERRISVFLAHPGRPVVLSASGHRGAVEGVDGGLVAGVECDVGGRADLPFRHPEVVPAALDEPERVVVLPVHLVSQRRQRLLVEPPAGARIAAAEADVLDHAFGVRRAGRHRKSD